MNKTSITSYAIISILALFLIVITLKYSSNRKTLLKEQKSLHNFVEMNNLLRDKSKQYLYFENLSIGQQINTFATVEAVDGKRTSLETVLKEQPSILFFIDQTHCSSCWGKALEILLTKFPSSLVDHIYFLTSFQNFRDIVIPLQELKVKTNIYNIVEGKIAPQLHGMDVPLLVTINQNKMIDGMLVVDLDLIEQVEIFIKAFVDKNKINEIAGSV